ncbi:universal stress protein [Thermodesulfobacteriota bacterium]
MPEIKRILYSTDLSKNSAYAFQYAVDLAEKHNALIYILNVIEELPSSAKAALENYLSDEQLGKFLNRNAELKETITGRLSVFCENVQKGDPQCTFRVASIDVIEGHPVNEMLKKAEKEKCDMIVMGTHGKGLITHAILGSVAEKVIRRAKVPVMVIPIPDDESEVAYEI